MFIFPVTKKLSSESHIIPSNVLLSSALYRCIATSTALIENTKEKSLVYLKYIPPASISTITNNKPIIKEKNKDNVEFDFELNRIMEGKLKRIRFNKDGTLDFDIETEDGKRAIVKGCSLHVDKNNE